MHNKSLFVSKFTFFLFVFSSVFDCPSIPSARSPMQMAAFYVGYGDISASRQIDATSDPQNGMATCNLVMFLCPVL
jgi:hypothetical protein